MILRGIRADLRFASAIIILAFVICHLINHALALISLETAIAAQDILLEPWDSHAGTIALVLAGLIHYGNALWAIYLRRSLRMPLSEAWQTALGLLIPVLMTVHLGGTRLAEEIFGLDPSYRSVLVVQWVLSPWKGIAQAILVLVVWGHACVGLHLRLQYKAWYSAVRPWLLGLAVFIPTIAVSGWVAAAGQVIRAAHDPAWVSAILAEAKFGPTTVADVAHLTGMGIVIQAGFVLLPFVARHVRRWTSSGRAVLSHSNGRTLKMMPGATILDTLRDHGVPHASVCGGKARCTTCRIRVLAGGEDLPKPESEEATALARIEAPADVRLACQVRPVADVSILPLLPADANAADGNLHGGMDGRERQVVVVFVDLRGSTTLGEAKLPYDVLFILHRFFQEMTKALVVTGGYYSNFTGDGLMALYGLDRDDPAGAVADALSGSREMISRMERLNRDLALELTSPLRMGIGIHFGDAIVGSMGPPGSKIVSAIGDTVNTAARLEGLTKDHDCPLVLSRAAADVAGLVLPETALHQAPVKGRVEPVWFYALDTVPVLRN